MKAPEVRIHGSVTTATATALTVTPSGAKDANAIGATLTTVVINGTGIAGFVVGDRLELRLRAL
jgi:Na+/glutamate symporter